MEWDVSSEKPLAYTSRDRAWGLVKGTRGKWALYLLSFGSPVGQVKEIEDGGSLFDVAKQAIDHFYELRKSAQWVESTIGKRRPGEEGPDGATPISVSRQSRETADQKMKRRKVK